VLCVIGHFAVLSLVISWWALYNGAGLVFKRVLKGGQTVRAMRGVFAGLFYAGKFHKLGL
jgi:hypothetical protein